MPEPTPPMTEREQAAYDQALKRIEARRLDQGIELDLSHLRLPRLPPEIGLLDKLTVLRLDHNELSAIPPLIGQFGDLKVLYLSENQLSTLPPEIGQLGKLTGLSLSGNRLSTLPLAICKLANLTGLDLSDNQLSSLPPEIGQLTELTKLSLNDNQLSTLPSEIGQLSNLTLLNVFNNQLSTLPAQIGQLTHLTELYLSDNHLITLPEEIGRLSQLERLTLERNMLSELPECLMRLIQLEVLALQGNEALELPTEVLGPTFGESSKENRPAKPQEILGYYFKSRGMEPIPVNQPSKPPIHFTVPGTDQTDGSAMQDQASRKDTMGRAGMIAALGAFISSKDSLPPLSITIEAPWGEGKSSAMAQLREYLTRIQKSRTVWFNPWRYTEAEALWSGFLAEFTEQVQEGRWFLARIWMQLRYVKAMHGWVALYLAILSLVFPFVVYALKRALPNTVEGWSKFLVEAGIQVLAWAPLIFVAVKLLLTFYKPVRTFVGDMETYLKMPDYAANRGSSERLHLEFRAWLEACTKPGERVYVFIDDLDRCAGPRAAELLEWLQLMMSDTGDGSKKPFPLVVVAGLDRKMVAAAVAMRHSQILPILAPADTPQSKAEASIIWGYEYLEKFVDLPVRLPPGSPKVLESYLKDMAPGAFEAENREKERQREIAKKESAERKLRRPSIRIPAVMDNPVAPSKSNSEARGLSPAADVGLEDWRIPGLLRAAAVWLNHSPRRMKHFLNLLRLRWAVRKQMGKDQMTLALTARLVLLETARPTLFRAIADNLSVRDALFDQMDEESHGVFRQGGVWKTQVAKQVFEADKIWLTMHGKAVLVDDWDDILNDSPYGPPEAGDELALTRLALDALIDGTPYLG